MPYTPHVLRCDDVNTTYVIDRRHSILVPLKPPAPGTQSVTFCFRFMCLSSCIGSLNRRPTKLIFTLETLRLVKKTFNIDFTVYFKLLFFVGKRWAAMFPTFAFAAVPVVIFGPMQGKQANKLPRKKIPQIWFVLSFPLSHSPVKEKQRNAKPHLLLRLLFLNTMQLRLKTMTLFTTSMSM